MIRKDFYLLTARHNNQADDTTVESNETVLLAKDTTWARHLEFTCLLHDQDEIILPEDGTGLFRQLVGCRLLMYSEHH